MRGLTRDTLVYGVGGSATRIIGILLVPIFTRVFTPADYGALDLLTTQISILTILSLVGLNAAVFYHYRRVEEADERRRLVGTALAMATAAAVLLGAIGLVFSGDIAELILSDRAYAAAVAASFLWLPVNVALTLALDLLRLDFRAVAFSAIGVGRSLLAWAVGLGLVIWADLGIEALLLSHAILGLAALVLALWLTRSSWVPGMDTRAARTLLSVGVPLVPASLFSWLMTYSDRFFLVQFREITDVGHYAIAIRLAGVLSLLIVAFETAWYPFAYASAQRHEHRVLFARVLTTALLGMLPLAGALGLFAREALLLLTTPAYLPAYPYVGLLALALVANGASQVVIVGVQLSGRTWHIAWTAGAAAALNVALNLALIPPLGVLGAATSALLGFTASATLLYAVGRRVYPIPYRFGRVALMGALTGVALIGGIWVDSQVPGGSWSAAATLAKLAGFTALAAVAVWLLDFAPVRLAREIAVRLDPRRR